MNRLHGTLTANLAPPLTLTTGPWWPWGEREEGEGPAGCAAALVPAPDCGGGAARAPLPEPSVN